LALKLTEEGIPHLFYADDLKIFFKIKSHNDHDVLQHGINILTTWCKTWGLVLNLDKCQVLTFHSYRNLNPHFYPYTLNNTIIARVNTIKDLGVLFQSNCLFNQHINSTANKAFKMLGFIKRALYFVKDLNTVLTTYYAVVRSIISYASVVWSPNQVYLINEIERVQRNFVRYVCNKFKYDRDEHSYEVFCKKFNMLTLQQHRLSLGLNFFYSIIHSKIQSPDLLKNISLYIPPVATRRQLIFGLTKTRTDYKRRVWYHYLANYCNEKNLNPHTKFSKWREAVVQSFC